MIRYQSSVNTLFDDSIGKRLLRLYFVAESICPSLLILSRDRCSIGPQGRHTTNQALIKADFVCGACHAFMQSQNRRVKNLQLVVTWLVVLFSGARLSCC
jgi:hypothetical protein